MGAVVRDCLASGRELPDLSLDELRSFSEAFGPAAVGITPERAVAARRSYGGTAPERVREALAEVEPAIAASEEWAATRRSAHPTLTALLERAWDLRAERRSHDVGRGPGPHGDSVAGSPLRDFKVRLATTPADWAVALAPFG